MSDTVFILGAGASVNAGAPHMGNFLDEAENLLDRSIIKEEDKEDFELFFEARGKLQSLHSKAAFDIDNIEEVFSAFEIAKVLGKFEDFTIEDIEKINNSVKTVIVKTLENKIKFPFSEGDIKPPKLYKDFIDTVYELMKIHSFQHTVSIITFNYDILVDFVLYKKFPLLSYTYALENENFDINTIRLLKLHGSLNWGFCPTCKKVVAWPLSKYFNKYGINPQFSESETRINIGSRIHEFCHCNKTPVEQAPFIIPPTWDKFYHSTNIARVWKQAAIELSQARNIIIVGYSFPATDAFFRYLYALGSVGKKPLKNFTVINPEKSMEEHFKKLLGIAAVNVYEFVNAEFGAAISVTKSLCK